MWALLPPFVVMIALGLFSEDATPSPREEDYVFDLPVHISMSTISVDLSRRLAKSHADKHQNYIASPVFG